ncbi:MAG: dicarboxylate transporter/tellurite-resistance protein TehA [Massilia sp.]
MKFPTAWIQVSASYFSITLGLAGLGSAWRRAHQVWGLPAAVGESILGLACAVWLYLLIAYAAKWLVSRKAALSEATDPVQCCFLGLVGAATMLVALAALPYGRALALALMWPGAAFTIGFAAWRTGKLWSSERSDGATTAVLYLPSVAGGFVCATALGALGWPQWGQMAFGGALLSWLAIESVLLRRLLIGPAMPPALRPTMGIQLAPPVVGLVAYLSVSGDTAGVLPHAMLGYGLLQVLVLAGRLRWLTQQAFTPSYWGFSFGATAIAQAPLIMMADGASAPAATLAPLLFVLANLLVAVLVVLTLRLLFSPKLTPAPTITSA